jgi:hypothetical protein
MNASSCFAINVKERTDSFVDVMVRFIEEHPACNAILDAPAGSKRDRKIREGLRGRLANVIRIRRPTVSQEQAYRLACVSVQIIKSMNALYVEAKSQERPEIVREYKIALTAYLEKRLT